MKNKLLSIALLAMTSMSFAQTGKQFWRPTVKKSNAVTIENKMRLTNPQLFEFDINGFKQIVSASPKRFISDAKSPIIVSFPNAEGQLENFRILESSNMDPELAAKYPEIKSYIGQGVENPTSTIYFSISPLGLQSMLIKADQSAVFIEPYTTDLSTYSVYRKADKAASLNKFECTVINNAHTSLNRTITARPNADDGNLRTFRLALSVTGEYTTYFGGTKALALAAMNNSMTRVNGVFEKDFGVHMNLIANDDLVIYTSASTDPYSAATAGAAGSWNQELQTALTSTIGSANYDIGHLFGASGGGGNAGCIACVCINPTTSVPLGKGSGFTSPSDGIPQGDNFDIDYVAHEMGHQFGGNHTFTHSNEGTIAQVEPGSGTTIMGYAGITGATDVQAHSDPFFHAVSIQQITNYVKSTTCQTTTVTGNAIPTANAGLDYTIPKGTPFMLTGSGTDANADALTYDWEQMDKGTTTTTYPSITATTGPAFKSFVTSTKPTRYFPQLATILTGATSWKWEAVPNVARTLNFRLTVRDNHAGGPANNSDDMIVTVNTTAGPFLVSAPNTAVSYIGGSSQTVTWAVAGTTANNVNCANVDILLSTDGGLTYPTTLLAATPNDGTQVVTIPNTPGTQNRIMVKGSAHIFFDVSNVNFTITAGTTDTVAPTAPTTLAASGTTQTTTNLTWTAATDNVAVSSYDVYQGTVLKANVTTTSYAVTGLTAATAYTFTVKAKDAAGNVSVASNVVSITTLALDTTAPTAPSTLAASGTTQTTTNLTWKAATDNIAVTSYDVYQGTVLKANVTTLSYAVTGLTASTAYTFSVKAKDAAGNVSVASNVVSVTTLAPVADTTAPTAPTTLTASGTTQTTTNLTWTASTDNVAVTSYDVYQGAVLKANVTTTSYAVTGLTAATAYTFTVKAKDAAGNVSVASNVASVTTLANVVSTYCTSQGNSAADEKIGKVVFGTISNTSTGGTGYENFTALATNAVRGTVYTITITPVWTATKYSEGYSVWIDYNGDGDFADAGEQVWTKAASTTTPVTGTFTIPTTATLGSTRMRVSMKYNAVPSTSCEAFSFGQVEDYTVNIVLVAREVTSVPTFTFNLYPNPVNGDILNISSVEKGSYRILNLLGQEVSRGNLENEMIPVSNLNYGTYLLEVSSNDQVVVKRFIKQ
jgi:chitodextrinase